MAVEIIGQARLGSSALSASGASSLGECEGVASRHGTHFSPVRSHRLIRDAMPKAGLDAALRRHDLGPARSDVEQGSKRQRRPNGWVKM